jgi:hypothetical protein
MKQKIIYDKKMKCHHLLKKEMVFVGRLDWVVVASNKSKKVLKDMQNKEVVHA